MTIEQFTAAIQAQPFRPFVLHTVSGKAYRVSHPELAMRTPAGRTVVLDAEDGSSAVLDLLLIEAIIYETLRPPSGV